MCQKIYFPHPHQCLMVWNLILLIWLSSSQVTSNCHLKLLVPNYYWVEKSPLFSCWSILIYNVVLFPGVQQSDLVIHTYIKVSLVAQTVKNLPAVQETQVRSLGWEDPLEKRMAIHSSYSPWSRRVRHDWVTN